MYNIVLVFILFFFLIDMSNKEMMIYLLLSNFIDLVSKISQISLVYSFHQLKDTSSTKF